MKSVANLLISIGLLSIIIGLYFLWERNNPNRLSFNMYQETNYANYSEYPVRIKIPSIGVDLPIVHSSINGTTWETTKDGVSYLVSSPIPGKMGNSIMYGHNWNNLLGNLHKASPGDYLEIEYNTGLIRIFTIQAMGTVTPDQTHVLSESNDVRITLYTCTGFLDSKRLVVTAVMDKEISTFRNVAFTEVSYVK